MPSHKLNAEALKYHSKLRAGKIEVLPTKACRNQKDLSLAYSPGVAEVCREIQKNPELAYKYTAKGNLVGVISNGSAVLGLGNIGALAGKAVMEGKGVLFKCFADIDCFDINLNESDPDKFCEIVKAMEPTFGGINLEDIKAPECFYIEQRLKKEMKIPVFHDDQHGTAIISGAGLINALQVTGKKVEKLRIVVNGAGAAAVACTKFYIKLGVQPKNIAMFDSKGLIYNKRSDFLSLSAEKKQFASAMYYENLTKALQGADMFLGLSVADVLNKEMLKGMAASPIIFACANPDPEISYPEAKAARPDAIMCTGRSDYPNQINNVSGFPYIFRGALDVRASEINDEMKIAAAYAIARLAQESAPAELVKIYGNESFSFGIDYIIPKALDPRLLIEVSAAVAEVAMDSGVAGLKVNLAEYKKSLALRIEAAKARREALLNCYNL